MFVSLLNGDQQSCLIEAAHAIASVNGTVHDHESELIDAIVSDGALLSDSDIPSASVLGIGE